MNRITVTPAAGAEHLQWRSDKSLRRAGELIENSSSLRAITFDFFDTLVWRLVARPTDVFVEAGQRLRQDGLLPAHVSPQDYEVLRRQAERKAREHQSLHDKSREDITLAEIFQQLKNLVPQADAAAQIELTAEGDFCLLNPQMIEFARHAKQRGLKLFVISDIYLSSDHLRAILRANHFDPTFFDDVYTSSDAGVCKGTGRLFTHVLKQVGLKPEEVLHIGDNIHADIAGARKVGVLGCHYVQATNETAVILDREKFLLGASQPVGSVNSLRLLAARAFAGDTDENFFSRAGALLLGPLLTRYASWACEQFIAAGVRKVGAFMREGEILGQLLRHEAAAMGHALEVEPLYVNRKSTDLAALGKLTADNLIDWLERRQTLSVKAILEHFGLRSSELRNLPVSPDEKISSPERIILFAKFLFSPEIARRIEQRSAEERRKVIEYLKPWLESGGVFGVCDIGYNATAQMQLRRIFELEGCRTKMVGCYLVTCERAAQRLLDGLDVRHFLGAFGNPGFNNSAFLRSPAFIEQSLVAGSGTTLGYDRAADGSVRPVLDEMRFPPELLRRQRAFKDGVLYYQKLWLHFRAQKPGLLDGKTEFSCRLLADLDLGCTPILARVTAFPTQNELAHFGSLPLDDYYFAEGVKTICGEKERELARTKGYSGVLHHQGVLWPQAASLLLNPKSACEFFAYAKSMLLCQTSGDNDGVQPELLIVVLQQRDASSLRASLNRLKSIANSSLRCEILLLAAKDDREPLTIAQEFSREIKGLSVLEIQPHQTAIQQLNQVVDGTAAPFVMFLDERTPLAPGWETTMLKAIRSTPEAGIVLPASFPPTEKPSLENSLKTISASFLIRRLAFIESLGFNEKPGFATATWNLIFKMQNLGWRITCCDVASADGKDKSTCRIPASDVEFLKRGWPDMDRRLTEIMRGNSVGSAPEAANPLTVDWFGSFLDHGSLSHVNVELTGALDNYSTIRLQRVSNGAPASAGFETLTGKISATASADAAVTVRHAWPPDWRRPHTGKLVVIQPWEFGTLPEQWVQQARNVDEFWVPSEYVRRVYVESGVSAQKVFVVPNGVNLEKFHPQVAPMKLATAKKFKFLFVGGTIFRKGPDVLLKAYLEQFTAADDVCLVIKDFGGASVYAGQTFEAKIRAAQAQPNAPEILYLNEELPPDALPGLYTACDCLVLPYRGEGFGLPVIEAMACGLPVIVTAGGATDDFVRDTFAWRIPSVRTVFGREISGLKLTSPGWLLEPNLAALSQALRAAFASPSDTRQRGQLATDHAKQYFTWKNAAAIAAKRLSELARVELGKQPATNTASPAKVKITLPPCALVGHLGTAREQFSQKRFSVAWASTMLALAQRPFHPEAFLMLAEIAHAAGDGPSAKLCAEHARAIAPGWKPAKKFLNQRLKGGARPEWLVLPDQIRNQASEIRNQLSVCLIVKNEEKFLGQCLKSIRDLATQIVVVDTGSTDRTVEIAKEYGAEVYAFTWCDDFSVARNAALEHATGDWVLVLDADEKLSATGSEALKTAMGNAAVMAWRLPIVDVGREADGFSYVPRLFRNAPGLFYVGRVHEQVFSSIEVRRGEWGLENRVGDATLIHHGYTAEMTRDRNKVERNLKLLERAVEELPDEPHLLMNLGLELGRSGRETEALERYRQAFSSLSSKPVAEIVPELRETLLAQFCTRLTAAKQFQEVGQVLTSSLAKMSGGLTASMHFSLGLAYFELKQFSEAAGQMRQCLAKRTQRSLAPINKEINSAAPRHCLAISLAQAGDMAAAEQAFEAGLQEVGHGDVLRLDYARFLAGQDRPVDALHRLNEVIAENSHHLGAWQLGGQIALSRPEFLEFARDWTGEAMRNVSQNPAVMAQRAEALMLSQDVAAAFEIWKQVWNLTPNPVVLAALIFCEVLESPSTHAPQDDQEEIATSRAFIGWYRKMLAVSAQPTILRLNGKMDKLARTLPGAAKVLDAAFAEASQASAAGAVG